jgi:hypothetical protein
MDRQAGRKNHEKPRSTPLKTADGSQLQPSSPKTRSRQILAAHVGQG